MNVVFVQESLEKLGKPIGVASLLLASQLSIAGVGVDTSALTEAMTVEGVRAHQASSDSCMLP